MGYNGPLLIANYLGPGGRTQRRSTRRSTTGDRAAEATEARAGRLQAQADALKSAPGRARTEQARLERGRRSLQRRKAELERQEAALRAEEARLRAEAERLVRRAAPIVAHLARVHPGPRALRPAPDRQTDRSRPAATAACPTRPARGQGGDHAGTPRAAAGPGQQSLVAQAESLFAQAETPRGPGRPPSRLRRTSSGPRPMTPSSPRRGQLQARGRRPASSSKRRPRPQKKVALRLQKPADRHGDEGGRRPTGHRSAHRCRSRTRSQARPGVVGMFPPQINDDGDAATLSAIPERAPSSDATADAGRRSRDDVLPATNRRSGIDPHVGGSTASNVDLATVDRAAAAARGPHRARAQLPAADGGLPFAPGAGAGRGDQPALGGGRPGRADRRLPVGLGAVADRAGRARVAPCRSRATCR